MFRYTATIEHTEACTGSFMNFSLACSFISQPGFLLLLSVSQPGLRRVAYRIGTGYWFVLSRFAQVFRTFLYMDWVFCGLGLPSRYMALWKRWLPWIEIYSLESKSSSFRMEMRSLQCDHRTNSSSHLPPIIQHVLGHGNAQCDELVEEELWGSPMRLHGELYAVAGLPSLRSCEEETPWMPPVM